MMIGKRGVNKRRYYIIQFSLSKSLADVQLIDIIACFNQKVVNDSLSHAILKLFGFHLNQYFSNLIRFLATFKHKQKANLTRKSLGGKFNVFEKCNLIFCPHCVDAIQWGPEKKRADSKGRKSR